MVYESEAIIPTEFDVTSQWRASFNPSENDQLLAANLDLLHKVREEARIRVAIYQQRVAKY